MMFFLTLVTFILIISFLIFSHELGHFIIAKRNGLFVEEFALGFPPKIFSKKIGETEYSLNMIPFGGYVKIHGEDGDEGSDDKRSFHMQRPLVKAKVLLAGVFFNLIVAVLIFYIILFLAGFKWNVSLPFDYNFVFGEQRTIPLVVEVVEDSPAEKVGIKERDLILSVNGFSISGTEELIEHITRSNNEKTLLLRNIDSDIEREVVVIPEEGAIGTILIDITEIGYVARHERLFSGFFHAANMTHLSFYSLLRLTGESISERTAEPLRESTAGVVGIFAITHIVMGEGIVELLNMVALISIGLAIVNILPIPALDGGRLVFVLYEAILKKRAPSGFERKLNLAGFIFLIFLIITITYNDIIRFGGLITEMF